MIRVAFNQIDDIIIIKRGDIMKRLRELREKKGYTLEQVATELGLRNQYVSNYELGKRNPDYETLKKFADFYNVTTDYILGKSDIANPYVNMINEKNNSDFSELDNVYLSYAKEAQENKIDPADIRLVLDTIKKLREQDQ